MTLKNLKIAELPLNITTFNFLGLFVKKFNSESSLWFEAFCLMWFIAKCVTRAFLPRLPVLYKFSPAGKKSNLASQKTIQAEAAMGFTKVRNCRC